MNDTTGTTGTAAGPGPLADEAAKLFEAAQAWLGEHSGGLSGLLTDRLAAGSTECQLCPLCQLIGLFRAAQPAAAEHLADAAMSLLAALRVSLEAHERQWAAQRSGRRATGVEHIDIGE
jgi:Family of unknown function (DUF5304)